MGQMGEAMKNPNTMAPSPSGLNGSEWASRLLGGAAQGTAQGMQNMGGPPKPPGADIPVPPSPAPQINLPTQGVPAAPMPQRPGPSAGGGPPRRLFYGQ